MTFSVLLYFGSHQLLQLGPLEALICLNCCKSSLRSLTPNMATSSIPTKQFQVSNVNVNSMAECKMLKIAYMGFQGQVFQKADLHSDNSPVSLKMISGIINASTLYSRSSPRLAEKSKLPGEAQNSKGAVRLVRPALTPQRVAPKVVAENLRECGANRPDSMCWISVHFLSTFFVFANFCGLGNSNSNKYACCTNFDRLQKTVELHIFHHPCPSLDLKVSTHVWKWLDLSQRFHDSLCRHKENTRKKDMVLLLGICGPAWARLLSPRASSLRRTAKSSSMYLDKSLWISFSLEQSSLQIFLTSHHT